ncbi:MAG TPA: PHP domain-containing protein [Bacteroidales bacterium]|nr:PHP domain-containing protein [Bacteroidales bacterium]
MNVYKADLHIHTVLSPCGDLEMSPSNIIRQAKEQKLDIIGITDHNSTRHCKLTAELGERQGIFVLTGVEITTREEVHCLAFFEKPESIDIFQKYLEQSLPYISNNPQYFGFQVVVDEHENIVEEIDPLLITALKHSIDDVRVKVAELNGIFIPAHVDRPRNGILDQLGFMPDNLNPDAIEIWNRNSRKTFLKTYTGFDKYQLLISSDSHTLQQIGTFYSELEMQQIDFNEIRRALTGSEGRRILQQ